MKPSYVLPLAAIASAFVIPDAETARSLQLQLQDSQQATSLWDDLPDWNTLWHEIDQKTTKAVGCAKQKLTNALDFAYDTAVKYDEQFQTAFAGEAWLEYFEDEDDSSEFDEALDEGPPHHGPPPPHHGPPPPHHERPPPPPPPHERPPHDGPPHRRPHHPPHHGPPHRKRPHHGPPNRTVYELIAESKYTTKLAKAINEFPDLVELLNGTAANYTVFAPTDKAFEKIPKHAPKPTKEQLKKLLTYHVSSEFYPAGRVLVTRTIPSALDAEYIKDVPQRLSTQISLRGLTVNFYSRIIAANIFGTNGVIHGVDSILLPPPKVIDILTALPGEFSTLELALWKTGLFEQFNDTSSHDGGTIFAPNNWAFKKLGPRANAFLFSEHGLKYLKALILYHVVGDITLYSDAIYKSKSEESLGGDHRIPKGVYHIDLPTALEGKKLSVDVARYGRLIEIKINAFNRVAVTDGIAADGVIQVVNNLLIPPKEPHAAPIIADESLTVEELKAALAPYVEQDAADDYDWEL